MKDEIFTTVELLNGDKIDVLFCKGLHMTKAQWKYQFHTQIAKDVEYDIVPFIMEQLCLVNGKQKGIEYYVELMIDDYIKISDALQLVINSIS